MAQSWHNDACCVWSATACDLAVRFVSHFLDVSTSCKSFSALAGDDYCAYGVIALMLLSRTADFSHDLCLKDADVATDSVCAVAIHKLWQAGYAKSFSVLQACLRAQGIERLWL